MEARIYELMVKRVVESYESLHKFSWHHVESYEHFLHFQLRDIIFEQCPIDIYCPKQKVLHRIEFDDLSVQRPTIKEADGFIGKLTPTDSLLRKQTYCADVYVDLTHKCYKSEGKKQSYKLESVRKYQNVLYFKLPCMRNSTVCHDSDELEGTNRDNGTFIINGYEKVMITQEKLKTNFPYVCTVRSAAKYTHRCQIRSYHPSKIRSTSTLNIFITAEKATTAPEIAVVIPFIKHHIPLTVIFRLLGVNDVKRMIYYITGITSPTSPTLLYKTQTILCNDSSNTIDMNPEELFDWIGVKNCSEKQKKKRIAYVQNIFQNEFLPHCGNEYESEVLGKNTNTCKAFYLGYAVRKLLMVYLNEIPPDDIDSYVHKRACSTGPMFALLTRQLNRNFLKMLRIQIFKAVSNGKYINILDYINHRKISSGLKYGCATGNWGIQKGANNQTGVCQVLNTMNLSARYSHMRLINTPLNRDGKLPHPRQLRDSHYGIFCAAETPEGKSVGLLNVIGTLTRIRVGYQTQSIINILFQDMNVIPLLECTEKDRKQMTIVLINGIICGCVENPLNMVKIYKSYRKWHDVPIDTSITYREKLQEISIQIDAGDCYVPYITVENVHKLPGVYSLYSEYLHLLWPRLLIEGVIEYVSKEEQENAVIATSYTDFANAGNRQFTHMELHVSFSIFGISAGIIPFPNHNQGTHLFFTKKKKSCIFITDTNNSSHALPPHPKFLFIFFFFSVQHREIYTKVQWESKQLQCKLWIMTTRWITKLTY